MQTYTTILAASVHVLREHEDVNACQGYDRNPEGYLSYICEDSIVIEQ